MWKKLALGLLITSSVLGVSGLVWQTVHRRSQPFALSLWEKWQPWYAQTGRRIGVLRQNVPTVNQVVIVPDLPTFLVAIQEWSLQGRWPILLKDSKYTQLFLEGFKPEKVIRLPSVNQPLATGQTLRTEMLKSVAAAWEVSQPEQLGEKWRELGWKPPGVVMTWEQDPSWPAAVALAADRGQPLTFLPGDFGKPNDVMSEATWETLKNQVQSLVMQTGYPAILLGDVIDTITIVRDLAVKREAPPDLRLPPNRQEQQLAVMDGLARYENEQRWAIASWIYGDTSRAIYQAMSAIFLNPETALLYNSYEFKDNWNNYRMNRANNTLKWMGFNTQLIQRPQASLETWKNLVKKPFDFDLILINSQGNARNFRVGDQDARVQDIPALKSPAIVHIIHSWSATRPGDKGTIAGRWLDNGVYVYIGSVHEPYLTAFVTPQELVNRLQQRTPMVLAARQFEEKPWKITTIGDPLMTLLPPRRRVSPQDFFQNLEP